MKIGYARVSTNHQNLEVQKEALLKAGCEKIYEEKASSRKERKELDNLINHIRKGDTVIVWKLDRLGRTTLELIGLLNEFNEKGVKFKSLNDSLIDTTTANGKLVFSIFSALAEHEREIIRERTKAGLESARARGKKGGRPKGLSKDAKNKAAAAVTLYNKGESIEDIIKSLDISRATLYRYLRYEGLEFSYIKK